MIFKSIAPSRLSLFGGGTDIEPYASQQGGIVLNFAINLRQSLTIYTGDDLFNRAHNSVPYHGDVKFLEAFFTHFNLGSFHDVRFEATSDVLLNSGLGASAAAAVATVGAIDKLNAYSMSRDDIAQTAWAIEVVDLKMFGGKQDQVASVWGGINFMELNKEKLTVTHLDQSFIKELLPYIQLFHTNSIRENTKIQEQMNILTKERKDALNKIKQITLDSLKAIAGGDIEKVGDLLSQSWELKKLSNSKVSTLLVDNYISKAKDLGALGGKLCGSGGGGYMFFLVPPEKQEAFKEQIGMDWWDFSIDWNGLETRIL